MKPTLSLLHTGCTRTLDLAIQDERKRYAAERLDFHDHFDFTTVHGIQRALRGGPCLDKHFERSRADVVTALLEAQQESPHRLWELLLIQAFEQVLVRRRRAISREESVALDDAVLEAFLGSLHEIPYEVAVEDLKRHVLTTSRRALAKVMRDDLTEENGRMPLPPESGVVCLVEHDDESDPPEVA